MSLGAEKRRRRTPEGSSIELAALVGGEAELGVGQPGPELGRRAMGRLPAGPRSRRPRRRLPPGRRVRCRRCVRSGRWRARSRPPRAPRPGSRSGSAAPAARREPLPPAAVPRSGASWSQSAQPRLHPGALGQRAGHQREVVFRRPHDHQQRPAAGRFHAHEVDARLGPEQSSATTRRPGTISSIRVAAARSSPLGAAAS